MDAMSRLSVLVIEDDAGYRQTLEDLLRHSDGLGLAGSFASAEAALAAETRCDIVLTDLELPGITGIEAARRFKERDARLKVVVLTVFEEPATILEAICAGADGYLLKKSRAKEIVDGLKSVAEGGSPLTPNVAHKLLAVVRRMSDVQAPGPSPTRLDLSEREQQVLRALVEGLSYKQVADVLGVSHSTVRSHVTATYRKLQVHSVAEAVSRALRERLV
jgi:DNA-binding NarL/FixJ family response regulator